MHLKEIKEKGKKKLIKTKTVLIKLLPLSLILELKLLIILLIILATKRVIFLGTKSALSI